MLLTSSLPKVFWGEAIKTACYLINRCSSAALTFKTPQEIWIGKPPEYSHLKVFGCSTYAYIKQDKLQPRAKKCVFLGYPEGIKGYRLWCVEPSFQKCLISRDVRFNEEEMPMKKDTNTVVTQKEEADPKLHFEVETESNKPGEQSKEIEEENSYQT